MKVHVTNNLSWANTSHRIESALRGATVLMFSLRLALGFKSSEKRNQQIVTWSTHPFHADDIEISILNNPTGINIDVVLCTRLFSV